MHDETGPLPEFQPNDDFGRALTWLIGQDIHASVAWLLLFVNGAVVWGFVFGQVYNFLPGKHPWQKGAVFGICAWIVMGFVFFPLVDRGVFAVDLGLGAAPAILLLAMLLTYSVTMSLVYHFLNRLSAWPTRASSTGADVRFGSLADTAVDLAVRKNTRPVFFRAGLCCWAA